MTRGVPWKKILAGVLAVVVFLIVFYWLAFGFSGG